jgi:hypothetical protein
MVINLHQRIPNWSIAVLVAGVLVLVAVLFTFSPAPAAPTITWTPSEVVETIAQGQTKTITVSFSSDEDLANVAVFIVPELSPYVSATPSSFSSISAGVTTTITLTLSAATDAPLGTIEGTLQLKDNSGKSQKTYAQPLPITLIIQESLAGIDADGDGVRDDIEQYIALTYPDSQKTQAALTQYAKVAQTTLVDADDKEASINHAKERSDALDCLTYIHGIDDAITIHAELRAQILNTKLRSEAWIMADGHLGGQVFRSTPMEERKLLCNFDPDAMEN